MLNQGAPDGPQAKMTKYILWTRIVSDGVELLFLHITKYELSLGRSFDFLKNVESSSPQKVRRSTKMEIPTEFQSFL